MLRSFQDLVPYDFCAFQTQSEMVLTLDYSRKMTLMTFRYRCSMKTTFFKKMMINPVPCYVSISRGKGLCIRCEAVEKRKVSLELGLVEALRDEGLLEGPSFRNGGHFRARRSTGQHSMGSRDGPQQTAFHGRLNYQDQGEIRSRNIISILRHVFTRHLP